ncbi:MAG: hypothetical protein JW839_20280, partial [Candidatus Lokiarchaeota archaeon]|nr:hypothetical protein [Candidatus Lokiarchaeota archaeon]
IPSQAMFYQQSGFLLYMLGTELQKEFPHYEKVRYIIDIEKPKMPEKPAGAGDEKPAEAEPVAEEKKTKKPTKKGSKKAAGDSDEVEEKKE